jgi:hypothetical protein
MPLRGDGLMKDNGDCLPKDAEPIFNDLGDIEKRGSQLNGGNCGVIQLILLAG